MNRNALKSKMALKGYSDTDLASMLKLSKSAISRRLSNEVAFSAVEIKEVKDWLHLTDKEVNLIFLD